MRTVLMTVFILAAAVRADEIPSKELTAGKDDKKKYFLIGDTAAKKPKAGFGLVIVLPGGDGGPDFRDFVTTIAGEALPTGYLVAQPVSLKWTENQKIVWPVAADKANLPYMKFTTEEFVDAIITDVTAAHTIDSKRIFTLTWSSSGPAAYAMAMSNPKITGSFVAMSVFKPDRMDKLENAKGKAFFLYHSPDDKICKYSFAKEAKATLEKHGGKVTLIDYDGGHGWHGATMDDIRTGIEWLQNNATAPPKK